MKITNGFWTVLIVATLVLTFLGCGVSTEEHEKTVAELNTARAELKKANAKIAAMDQTRLTIPKIDPELKNRLDAAQQQARSLGAKVKNLTTENSSLNTKLSELEAMTGDLQKKLNAFQGASKENPLDLFKTR
jgi:chromosome segregation ATPase